MTNSATTEYIEIHKSDDVNKLALQPRPDDVDITFALQQIAAWQTAKYKIPQWASIPNIIYPKHLSLEQCSGQNTALYKSQYIRSMVGKKTFSLIDLTGGLGIDCSYFARYADEVHYVEADKSLCEAARHNFDILKSHPEFNLSTDIIVHNGNAEDFIDGVIGRHFDVVYADPARRGKAGQKLVSVADCQPNIIEIQDRLLGMAELVVVKLSPMLDIKLALRELKCVSEVLVISSNGECKELLFIMRGNHTSEPVISAIELNSNTVQTPFNGYLSEEKLLTADYSTPLKYLYEPFPAHLKSGLFKTIAHRFNTKKISQHAHLYTSEDYVPDFPGRIFRIESCVRFDKRQMKDIATTISRANITTRHFPMSAEELHKRYKIKDGGDVYMFATTTADNDRVIVICHKVTGIPSA